MFCRLRITGEIPGELRKSSMILAANHIGTFDPFVLIAACARKGLAPRFLATAGLFRAPVFGSIMRGCGHIQVDRGKHTVTEALHNAIDALDEGSCILIYPEGRVTLDPGLWPENGKTGVARLALTSKAPVLAISQWGAHEVMAYDTPGAIARSLLTALWRRPIARVHFAGLVDLSGPDMTPRKATDRITEHYLDALPPLRADEPVLPRHIDPIRPLSSARTYRRPKPPDQ
ncbi:phospholipid/glycerol acyltransferase [Stackebrandtia nassauensis DSM 44728]|uniref:Phospholipid/glycerol acyltransferase n=2 Tax=Stackebrandtia TaxID=283810 RepID=D3PXP9_STANL|nr:phospholipid/glycerol acyltransferase [Stackebrandtia nassauensis DSM 44728]